MLARETTEDLELSPGAIALLSNYHFQNVRELNNLIERIVFLSPVKSP